MPKPKKKKPAKKKLVKQNKVHPNRQWCVDNANDEDLLFADGFDDCIIGVSYGMVPRVVYDKDLMIYSLQDDGMDECEAIEYLEFNTWGAWVGPRTPIYIDVKP